MMRTTHPSQRGFAALIVAMVVALVGIAATMVINSVSDDFLLVRAHRVTREARETAEGGLMEVINDRLTLGSLPAPGDAAVTINYTKPAQSAFDKGTGTRKYDATISLVRVVPMRESSHNIVRALVYEVEVEGRTSAGSTSQVRAQVFRTATVPAGVITPQVHAR